MRLRHAIIALAELAALSVAGCGQLHNYDKPAGTTHVAVKASQHLTRRELAHLWPLTVDQGTLACHADNAVTFAVTERRYGLNRIANEDGFAPIEPIARHGKSTGVLLSRGLGLCSNGTP